MANTGANASRKGRFVETSAGGEVVRAFVPPPLPPVPPVRVDGLVDRLLAAERALGRLDGITLLLPRPELFLYMYVRKEAVLSSQIEGTQSTLTDLLRFELDAVRGEPVDDIREVSNYVDAVMHGIERAKTLPISLRLIRELHERLLRGGRGGSKNPGEFRRTQNWIGGTRPGNAMFVPPPVPEMRECLGQLERFVHEEESRLPTLIKAGLIHVQFETIHPFLDGNGRIGRLLVTLYLCVNGVMQSPLLYLSLFLKAHRSEYYRLLQSVREKGAWEEWLSFFLEGVESTANQAFQTAGRIVELFRRDRERIRGSSALRVYATLQENPFATAPALVKSTGLTMPTVNAALVELQDTKIVREVTGKRRGRVFAYSAYLDILSEGTEPLPAGR